MRAFKTFIAVALVLLVAAVAPSITDVALNPAAHLHALWALMADPWPDPPVGALVFAAVGWCVLVRRRSSRPRTRDSQFND
jgi:hypothetical protein